jgi:hypothetical protein
VTNSGAVQATSLAGNGLAAPFTFLGGSYPGTGGTCGATLATSLSCTIVVEYAPTAAVVSNDTINLDYNNGAVVTNSTRDVTGTGALPASLAISDGPTYDYGSVTAGGTANYTFTVSNTGGVAATALADAGGLAAPFNFLGGTYPGTTGTCGSTLGAGASCTIRVRFAPTAGGAFSDTIDLSYFDGVAAQNTTRDIQGTGLSPASLTLSDGPTFDYGTVTIGNSVDKTFTVTNIGASSATGVSGAGLAVPYAFKGGSFPGTGGNCAASLAGGGTTCTIVVTFTPIGSGVQTDTIDISYNDGVAAQTASRDITGTAITPAILAVSDGPSYDFGTQATGSTTNKTFTITNSGGTTATGLGESGLAAPYALLGGGFPGTGGTCIATLAAGANCTIVVQYAPVGVGQRVTPLLWITMTE